LIRLRIVEKHRHLIPLDEASATWMKWSVCLYCACRVISRLSDFAARCGGRDLAARRAIDKAVFDLRAELSEACTKLAHEVGEPADADA